MHPKEVVDRVSSLIAPVLEADRFELVHVTYRSEAGRWVLRVFLDRPEGVTVDDCALVSRRIEDLIEVEDMLPHAYRLEVSSPGLDRVLTREEHFQRFAGKMARMRQTVPLEGRKNFRGWIRGCRQGTVELEDEQGNLFRLPLQETLLARLEIDTPIGRKNPLPGKPSGKMRRKR